jgi:predicted nucleic acid-binding protein
MPCGCLCHDDEACRYLALETAAKRAAAELRHAYRTHGLGHGPVDPDLVARAIAILEKATTGGSA